MKNWLMNIALDKWLHITVSIIIVCLVALVDVVEWNRPNVIAAFVGGVTALCIGVLKEIVWDFMLGRGTFDVKDLCADFLGSLIGFLLSWALLSVGGA